MVARWGKKGKRRHILDSNLWLLKSQLQDVKFIVGSCEKVLAVLFCSALAVELVRGCLGATCDYD